MTERILELVRNEVDGIRVMRRLKLSGLNPNSSDRIEQAEYKTAKKYITSFDQLRDTLDRLAEGKSGKELKKSINQWGRELHHDGERMMWRDFGSINVAVARAKMDFSKLIIEAFKKL
jgi:hypothetical protein